MVYVCVHAFYILVIWDQIIYSSRDYLDAIQKFDALSFLELGRRQAGITGENVECNHKPYYT